MHAFSTHLTRVLYTAQLPYAVSGKDCYLLSYKTRRFKSSGLLRRVYW